MPDYTDWGSDIEWSPGSTKTNWGGVASGAASGAATGTMIMPGWGTAIGAVIGGGLGYLQHRGKKMSAAEEAIQNWDILQKGGMKEFGPKAIGGGYQGILDYTDAVKAFQAGGVPNMSQLTGATADAQRTAGRLENYRPERLDRALQEERDYIANVNTNINPLALRQRKQADQAALLRKGSPYLSEYQRGTLNRQDRTAAEQAIAEQGVGMVEAGRGRIAGMSGQADALVQGALQAAMQGRLGIGQLQTAMAQIPLQYQSILLSHLAEIPGMHQRFLSQFNPKQPQYDAAKQGGKGGTDWGALAQAGLQAYSAYKGGGGAGYGGSSALPADPGDNTWL